MDNSILFQILQTLPADYRDFVLSDFIPSAVSKLLEGRQTPELTNTFENAALLYFLFVYTKSDIVEHLSQSGLVSEDDAFELATALIASSPKIIDDEIKTEVIHIIQKAPAPNLAHEIAEMEEELNSLHSIRTMAADMQTAKEATHQTSQDDLLKKDDTDEARWGNAS